MVDVPLTVSRLVIEPSEPVRLVAKIFVEVPLVTYRSVPVAFAQAKLPKEAFDP